MYFLFLAIYVEVYRLECEPILILCEFRFYICLVLLTANLFVLNYTYALCLPPPSPFFWCTLWYCAVAEIHCRVYQVQTTCMHDSLSFIYLYYFVLYYFGAIFFLFGFILTWIFLVMRII